MGGYVRGDQIFGDKVRGDKVVHAAGRAEPRPEPKVVLLMSANVDGRRPLSLDRERREVDAVIWNAHAGGRLKVQVADAVRLQDLQGSLLRHRPVIAHFSGHGSAAYGIMVADADGRPRAVAPDDLSDLFRILSAELLCVVLNACFTDEQAHLIAEHIPCVIGMRGGIHDDAAISFATAFYRGIAHGETISTAFDLGRNQLRVDGHPDAVRPQLVAAPWAARLRVIERS